MVNIDPHSPNIFPVFTPKFDLLVWLKYAFHAFPFTGLVGTDM